MKALGMVVVRLVMAGSPSSFETTHLAGGTCSPAQPRERTPRRPYARASSVGDFAFWRPARLGCKAGHRFGAAGRPRLPPWPPAAWRARRPLRAPLCSPWEALGSDQLY